MATQAVKTHCATSRAPLCLERRLLSTCDRRLRRTTALTTKRVGAWGKSPMTSGRRRHGLLAALSGMPLRRLRLLVQPRLLTCIAPLQISSSARMRSLKLCSLRSAAEMMRVLLVCLQRRRLCWLASAVWAQQRPCRRSNRRTVALAAAAAQCFGTIRRPWRQVQCRSCRRRAHLRRSSLRLPPRRYYYWRRLKHTALATIRKHSWRSLSLRSCLGRRSQEKAVAAVQSNGSGRLLSPQEFRAAERAARGLTSCTQHRPFSEQQKRLASLLQLLLLLQRLPPHSGPMAALLAGMPLLLHRRRLPLQLGFGRHQRSRSRLQRRAVAARRPLQQFRHFLHHPVLLARGLRRFGEGGLRIGNKFSRARRWQQQ